MTGGGIDTKELQELSQRLYDLAETVREMLEELNRRESLLKQ